MTTTKKKKTMALEAAKQSLMTSTSDSVELHCRRVECCEVVDVTKVVESIPMMTTTMTIDLLDVSTQANHLIAQHKATIHHMKYFPFTNTQKLKESNE
jgi:hypothetical protein